MSASIYYNWVTLLLLLFLVACAPGGSPTPSVIPSATPSATSTPAPEPSVSPTVAPIATDPFTPTPTPSPTARIPTRTATPTSTALAIIGPPVQPATRTPMSTGAPPELLAPLQGREYQNPIIFEWNSSLGAGQAYQVTVYHPESGHTVRSELLTTQQWVID
ncbi:MAG: hypothetical protein GY832_30250, partial [Chloroflexi bacterium]|nr:hypothetical protein [Chloroflexota bacterium]